MPLFAEIAMPSIIDDLGLALSDVGNTWAPYFVASVAAVLVGLGVVYAAFIGWRAYKSATSKV